MSDAFGVNDFYYYYRNIHKGTILKPMYRKIIKDFFIELTKSLIKGSFISIPYGLGNLYIGKYKPSIAINKDGKAYVKGNKAVDYKATKALWKTNPELKSKKYIYYENTHTDGYKMKLIKTIFNKKILNRFYNFKPAKSFSYALASHIFANPYTEYLEVHYNN